MRLIATEEAFSIKEVADELNTVAKGNSTSLDMKLVRKIYGESGEMRDWFLKPLLDIEKDRLRIMDENGVDMHILSLTAPGVQMFDAGRGTELASIANDRLADIVARHPKRFAGLASFAPQDPDAAAKEIERARRDLGLHGLVVNSHTNDEYLDDPKYDPILAAAAEQDLAIYIHPRAPSSHLAGAYDKYGMDAALWGYGIEVSTHCVRMILSGVFDRHPKLKIVIGHMGEAIPFWLWRLDFMGTRHNGSDGISMKLKPSEYFRRNFAITTSGQESHDALAFSVKVLGPENVMWAIDYPYQPTTPAVQFMNTAPLPEDVKEMVAWRNAARIFHID